MKDNLMKLRNNPYPGRGKRDKEKLIFRGGSLYRIQIGRSFTVFYRIYEESREVKILK